MHACNRFRWSHPRPVLMAYGWLPANPSYVAVREHRPFPEPSTKEGTTMKNIIKSGTFRTLMLLSALASSGLVLEAARRW